jgi:hypothetical protein
VELAPVDPEALIALGFPPTTPCWRIATAAPVNKGQPLTSYWVKPPGAAGRIEQTPEKHTAVFDGFCYGILGVEVATLERTDWGWEFRGGAVRLLVVHLSIWHPDWPFQATATKFPDGTELLLRGLSIDPPDTEWRAARQAWRILRTFRQERRGRRPGKAKYPTRASFVRKLHSAFERLANSTRDIADYSETAFAREWLGGSYEAYKDARDEYGLTFASICAAYHRFRAKRRAEAAQRYRRQ